MASPEPEFPATKSALGTIKDLNQIFFFIAFLIVGGMSGLRVLTALLDGPPRHVGVAVLPDGTAQGPESRSKVKYTKRFVAKVKDTYVFSLSSNVIAPFNRHARSLERGMRREDEARRLYDPAGDAVNLIFVGPDGEGQVLFEKDVKVNRYELSREGDKTAYGSTKFPLQRNLYLVTTADTNKDGFLNYEDNQTLYVSSYDGVGLKAVMEDVESYQELSENTFLLTQRRAQVESFFEYELVSGALRELIVPPLDGK